MGTDIYLNWKGKTDDDEKKQITGYSIEAGNVGYLRASIGMTDENAVLRAIFPDKVWESSNENGEVYDFKGNAVFLKSILKDYIAGKDIDVGDRLNKQKEMDKNIKKMFSGLGGFWMTSTSDKEDLDRRKVWAKSLIEFFELGIKLQEQGKKPRVYISW